MNAYYLVTLSFESWYPYAIFRWVRLECELQYELLVVWDTGRDWLKFQTVLIVIIV